MKKTLLLLAFTTFLCGGTIRLYNDSPFTLKAVIQGNEGTDVAEVTIKPQDMQSWTSGYGDTNQWTGTYNDGTGQPPYTVRWFCVNGDAFSVTINQPTGATVTALGGSGAMQCKPPKKKNKDNELSGNQ